MIDVDGFDGDAREAVARAQQVAIDLGVVHVGTEHLLLGLLGGATDAARALTAAGATMAAARHKVAETAARGRAAPSSGELALTARAARAVGRSHRISHRSRSELVGAGHLLLGVLDVEGTAGQVLRGIGVDVDAVRQALESDASSGASVPRPNPVAPATCPSCGEDLHRTLGYEAIAAKGPLGTTTTLVFSCNACGKALGVSAVGREE